MPFHCSFNVGIEIRDGRGRPLWNFFLWNFFEYSWLANSHVLLRELIFAVDKMSKQRFSFRNYFG